MSADQLNVLGRDVQSLDARGWRALRGNDIAMVLQDPRYALNPVKTVRAQLEEALVLHQRLNRRERQEKIASAVLAMGLDVQVLNRYPGELSGGMGQRVMYQGNSVDEMAAGDLPQATHPYTRTLWTCRPNAQTYGQRLPTLDRTKSFEESTDGNR